MEASVPGEVAVGEGGGPPSVPAGPSFDEDEDPSGSGTSTGTSGRKSVATRRRCAGAPLTRTERRLPGGRDPPTHGAQTFDLPGFSPPSWITWRSGAVRGGAFTCGWFSRLCFLGQIPQSSQRTASLSPSPAQ